METTAIATLTSLVDSKNQLEAIHGSFEKLLNHTKTTFDKFAPIPVKDIDDTDLKSAMQSIKSNLNKGIEVRKEKTKIFSEVVKAFTSKENEIEELLSKMQILLNRKAEILLQEQREKEAQAAIVAQTATEAAYIVSAFRNNLIAAISKFTFEQKQLCSESKPFVKVISDVDYKKLCGDAMSSVSYKHHSVDEAKKLVLGVFQDLKAELLPAYARDMAEYELQPSLEVAQEEATQAIEQAEKAMEAEVAMATTVAAMDTVPEIVDAGALKIKAEMKYNPGTPAEWIALIAFYHQKGKLTAEWCAKNLSPMLTYANSEYKKTEVRINNVPMVEVVTG